MLFLSVSLGEVIAPKFGTGMLSGGSGMLVRSPAAVELIAALATQTVFADVIDAADAAILRNTSTVDAVVLASFAMTEMLSTTAPSLVRQSTSLSLIHI